MRQDQRRFYVEQCKIHPTAAIWLDGRCSKGKYCVVCSMCLYTDTLYPFLDTALRKWNAEQNDEPFKIIRPFKNTLIKKAKKPARVSDLLSYHLLKIEKKFSPSQRSQK